MLPLDRAKEQKRKTYQGGKAARTSAFPRSFSAAPVSRSARPTSAFMEPEPDMFTTAVCLY